MPTTVSLRERCPACGAVVSLVWVHGHLQCPACKVVVVPCCNGETACPPAAAVDAS